MNPSILMVCARYYPLTGGTETHVHEVSKRLTNMGYRVTILTTDATGKLPRNEKEGDVEIVRLPAYPRSSDLYFAPELMSYIRKGNWDLLHLQGYHTFVAPLALSAARNSGIPYAVTFHSGGHSSQLRNWLRTIQLLVLRPLLVNARQLIGVSEFEADHFSQQLGVPRTRFKVVPNGAELPTVDPNYVPERDANCPLILSVGRLERYKGHQNAIRAFPKVLAQSPQARLRIVGTGRYESKLRELVKLYGLEKNIEIAGVPPTDREGMAKLLLSSSLVLLLSDYEAHPIAVMEALAMGRPVLVTDTSGLGELARRGFVRSIPLNAPDDAVAEAILDNLRDPLIPPKLDLPTWETCVNQLDQIYKEILLTEQSH